MSPERYRTSISHSHSTASQATRPLLREVILPMHWTSATVQKTHLVPQTTVLSSMLHLPTNLSPFRKTIFDIQFQTETRVNLKRSQTWATTQVCSCTVGVPNVRKVQNTRKHYQPNLIISFEPNTFVCSNGGRSFLG